MTRIIQPFVEALLVPALFAQFSPPPGAPGPWDNDLLVYRVSAANMEVKQIATFSRGGVPTLARLQDGRLIAAHQHFPENDRANFDKVAVRFSADDGSTWTDPEVIRLRDLPEGMRFPFDPTLVPLPDGQVRLYFTSSRKHEAPAIYSAMSSNGVDYTFEPGVRFGIEERPVIDCAVVLHQGMFHLYAPDNGREDNRQTPPGVGYHAISRDGLNFTRTNDVRISGRLRWLGNAQSDGKQITFFGTGDPGPPNREGPRTSFWMATSSDGQSWELAKSPQLRGADPGVVRLRDGGLLVVATGPPRSGTPSANRRRGERVLFHDRFEGKLAEGWTWRRENPGGWRIRNGALEIRVEPGNMWGPQNDARNVLVRRLPNPLPAEARISVTVSNKPTEQYEQVDLVWYYDDSHMVKIGQEQVDGKLSIVMGREEKDRTRTIAIIPIDALQVDLQLVASNNTVRGAFRATGSKEWREAGSCDLPLHGDPHAALQCYQGPAGAQHWARISDFQVSTVPASRPP